MGPRCYRHNSNMCILGICNQIFFWILEQIATRYPSLVVIAMKLKFFLQSVEKVVQGATFGGLNRDSQNNNDVKYLCQDE